MSLYLKSKSVYTPLRGFDPIFIPRPSTLADIKIYFNIRPGGDPSIYLRFENEVKLSKVDVIGKLMMD